MRINLLQLGTQGVDMKSNPLLLGNKKLHAATNLVFEEGVIKTRPGIAYRFLKAVGRFQGACEYRPMQGISSGRFSESVGGIAFVAGGDLWIGCKKVASGLSNGEINLFQAENFLILQNPESDTFWWDGEELIRSPGLNEVDWNETETPVHESELVIPEADIPECDAELGRESGIKVKFLVIDSVTEQPVSGVYVKITRNGNKAFEKVTDATGRFEIYPTPRTYEYLVTKTGYLPLADQTLVVNGTATEVIYDVCMPPSIVLNGETEVVVRLMPELDPFNIHGFLTVPSEDGGVTPGTYALDVFFGVPLSPVIPPGNAFRTKWRLHTDACGYDIEYYVGDLDNNGQLLTSGLPAYVGGSGFNPATKDFNSTYEYAEGMYLQLGVLKNGIWIWPEASPCIEGGNTGPP